jgi:RNA polymerase primary sigma factor
MKRFASNSPLDRIQRRRGVAVSGSSASGKARKAARRTFSAEDERILRELMEKEMDLIDNPVFQEPGAEKQIYDEAPDVKKPDASWYHPVMDDLGSKTRTPKSSEQVILTAAEERVLFLQLNYARWKIRELQREVWASPSKQPTEDQAREILRWYRKSIQMREQIAETNLALVLAMAKRTRMSEVDFADLVSEGNMALLRAVDKFDCERGFKFSTYACRAILKAFSRQGMKLSKYRQRFPTDFDPKLEKSNHLDTKRSEFVDDAASEVKRIVLQNNCDLSEIERTVIEHRFRLSSPNDDAKPMTLEQVGQIIGVTKERVRQIQNKALEKIRVELEDSFLEGPHEREKKEAARKIAAALN